MKKLLTLILALGLPVLAKSQSQADITGQVLGDSGHPAAGASVYLEGREGVNVTIADIQGQFSFECVDSGSYGLTAHFGKNSSERLALELAGQSQFVEAKLSRVDSRQQVKIRARSLSSFEAGQTMTLELAVEEIADGPESSAPIAAALAALPHGSYEIVVSSPGMAYVGTFEAGIEGQRKLKNGIVIGERDYLDSASQQAAIKNQDRQNL